MALAVHWPDTALHSVHNPKSQLASAYLPEDGVKVSAVELLWDARGGKLGSQEGHKLLKVHLAIA